jgi:phosphate starvation-inducible PhoH-like protein
LYAVIIIRHIKICDHGYGHAMKQIILSKLRPAVPKFSSRSPKQQRFIDILSKKEEPWIVVGSGPAGTGKTHVATSVGMHRVANDDFERLVFTRPIVPADEDLGYLPGSVYEKMHPWLHPVFDAMSHAASPSQIDAMVKNGTVVVAPLAYMRGRTFTRSWIICDEAQNCTHNQLLMLMTRIGEGSKMVIVGDVKQHDRRQSGPCALSRVVDRIREAPPRGMDLVEFGETDVVRHPVIPTVIELMHSISSSS